MQPRRHDAHGPASPGASSTLARAKVNLDLRILGRRLDGYHELDSLVAFAGAADSLTLHPGPDLGVTLAGRFGADLKPDDDNLVLRAAHALADEVDGLRWGRFHLLKRLPVASGIGGGSADAAAALRLLAGLNGLHLDDPALHRAAIRIGADVPVCLASRARRMSGIGERLGPPLTLPPLFAVLVNPGVPVATAAVFSALGLQTGSAVATSGLAAWAGQGGLIEALAASSNDLEAPALGLAPVLNEALAALRAGTGCRLARMSGSGATCFGLFDDCRQSAAAAKRIAAARPEWWVKPTLLR